MKRLVKLFAWIIATLLVVTAVAVVTEITMKKVVTEKFSEHTREFLNLSAEHPVEVHLKDFIIPQLLKQEYYDVNVEVSDVPVKDGLRLDLKATAKKLPQNPQEKEIDGAEVQAILGEEQLAKLIKELSFGIGQEVTIEQDHLKISNSVSVLGQKIPIDLTLELSAKNGKLHIKPITVKAAGLLDLTLDDLPNFAGLGWVSEGFDYCIADLLPAGVNLESVTLSTTKTLTLMATINPRIGIDPSLQENGECS